MAFDVIMPKLGLTMEEGTVIRWLVAEGDGVEKGQAILEVETDKVVVEVEAGGSGVMGPQIVAEGETVPVTTLLARIYGEGEKVGAAVPRRQGAGEADKPIRSVKQVKPGRVFSSPRARKRAGELGVDWRALAGSGPGGRVVEADVLGAHRPASIFAATAAPQIYLGAEARADAFLDMYGRLAPLVDGLETVDLLVKIAAAALAESESWQKEGVDVGVGLRAVIRSADRLGLRQIVAGRMASAEGASLRAAPDLLLIDLGGYRVDVLHAAPDAWPQPTGAVLAAGRVGERAVSVGGRVEMLPVFTLSLTCDRRFFDPVAAAGFLGRVVELIEEPYALLLVWPD